MLPFLKNIFYVFATVIVIFFVYIFLKWRSVMKKLYKIPGPKKLPILGNFLDFIGLDSVQLFSLATKWIDKYGPVVPITAFGLSAVIVSGATEFQAIAGGTKHIRKGFFYYLIKSWLNQGLLTSTGEQWHQRRKMLTPAFHLSILHQFVKVFNEETDKLIEILFEECKKPVTNVLPLISQTTLNIITETSCGTKLDMNNQDDKNYMSAIHEMTKINVQRLTRPWLYPVILFNLLSPLSVAYKKYLNTVHSFTNRIIKERERKFKPFEINENNKKKLTFLDLLLNAKLTQGTIDEQGIKDEVNTFIFGGHETIAVGMIWILRQLAINREFQEPIYEEIVSVLGNSQTHPGLNDLNEMKLLERFIKETLRLYPSVPLISRYLDEDIMLNGYTIPKESSVKIFIYHIHRNPKYWDDPEKFDPDRFLPENYVNRHPFAYVPFSAGSRNCIGQRFAMLELKAMLCGIVQNFTIETMNKDAKVEIMPEMVLKPAEEIQLKFNPRKV